MATETTESCSSSRAATSKTNVAKFNLLDDNAHYWILSKQPFSESEFIRSVAESPDPSQRLQITSKQDGSVKPAPRKVVVLVMQSLLEYLYIDCDWKTNCVREMCINKCSS